MKHVLITGANSFLGTGIAAAFANAGGYRLTGVVRETERSFGQAALYDRIESLEMKDYGRMGEWALPPVDTAVFLAWDGTRGKTRDDMERQEFSRRCTLEAFLRLAERGCRKFILAGSQAEYDVRDNPAKIDESYAGNPQTAYGIVKLRLYETLAELCDKKGCTLIEPRFFSVFGVGDFEGTLIMQTVRNMLRGEACRLTACNQLWNYTYVTDAARAVALLEQSALAKGVYNVGTDDTRRLRDFILEIRDVTGSHSEVVFSGDAFQGKGEVYANPDISRIVRETGWRPEVSFREGIANILGSAGHFGNQ